LKLDKFLSDISEIEFNEIFHRFEIARMLRRMERQYKKTHEQMAGALGLDVRLYLKWRKGAVDFSVQDLANLDVVETDFYSEMNIIKIELDKNV
jgi:hypothetical protein